MSGRQVSKRPRTLGLSTAELRALRLASEAIEDQALRLAGELLAHGASASSVAGALGVSRAQVYRLINSGRLVVPEGDEEAS
ncbi:MAG: hypothetical protein QOH79_2408 [Acidimicrobiaceae bacterium]